MKTPTTVPAMAVLLVLGFGPAAAQERRAASPDGEDLIRWIGDACPAALDLVTLMRLDQVAGKAVNDWLRTGRYRDAHALAVRYLDCLKRPVLAETGVTQSRVAMLEQVLCFLPLVIVEVEQRVDADLVAQSLARCSRPPPEPLSDRSAWAESVRRYLHLLAAVRPPVEVLDASLAFLAALRKAGFPSPGAAAPAETSASPSEGEPGEGNEPQATDQEGAPADVDHPSPEREDQGPDPVFAAMVLGIAASIAAGDLDALVRVIGAGSDEEACSSSFLAALGVMQALPMPRRAALPIFQTTHLSRVPLEQRLGVVRAAIERFGGKEGRPCIVPPAVASLVLASFDSDTFDRVVAEGGAEDLARVVGTASFPLRLPGSPASRAEVLRIVASQARGDEDRGRWLCALGDALLAAGRARVAASAFSSAAALDQEPWRRCGSAGHLRSLIADPEAQPEQVTAAARAFLKTDPDAPTVFAILAEAPDSRAKASAIQALRDAGIAPGRDGEPRGLVEAVTEAFIKVVDTDPGSEAARIALEAVKRAGGPVRTPDRVLWGLVSARHFVVAGQEAGATRALKEAFALARPDVEGAKEGTAALLRWLAVNDHVRVLDHAVGLALAARVGDVSVLAQVGAIRGERGDRRRAKALLRTAVLQRPSEVEDWLTIADAYARIDEPTLASAALDKAGPESSWDRRHFMIRGRIEMDRRRYREAAAAYTRASDMARGDCEPLFFRGLVRLLLGDAEGAVQDFQQCAALGEDSPQVLGGLAYAHFDQSDWDRAESVFREALARDEKTADNHLGLALTLFRQGRLDEARRSYERAVELEPAMKKGYAEAERKGYVYSAIEKEAWSEMVRALGARGRKR